ncbi:hypothetical protein P3390_24665, partial [Vibrio parahaemolyticus]|nr:hypothetical protein [Vibrio parahaemolyticus]
MATRIFEAKWRRGERNVHVRIRHYLKGNNGRWRRSCRIKKGTELGLTMALHFQGGEHCES